MIAPNHILAGTIIALNVSQPLAAVVLSYFSHFVLDALPHFEVHKANNVFERNKNIRFKIYLIVGIFGSIILVPLLTFWLKNEVDPWILITCIVAANIPDFAWIYRFIDEIITKKEKPKGKMSLFHSRIQILGRVWGWAVELLFFLVALYLIRGSI